MIHNNAETPGLSISQFIAFSLNEDIGDGDHTSLACINSSEVGKAIVKIKEDGIIAGVDLAVKILEYVDSSLDVKVLLKEGSKVKINDIAIEIEGNIQSVLKAERLLLNCMQRMSGIATATAKLVDRISGTNAKLLDTRKTTPNFRVFEKQAVKTGGGYNHRFGLFDMILIKDNHIDACGGITKAIQKANDYLKIKNKKLLIEIETRSIDEVKEVLRYGNVNRIMLDNFSTEKLKEAVDLINHSFETEASGGITFETIREVAECGVDYISVGALTHSYKSLDISLKIAR